MFLTVAPLHLENGVEKPLSFAVATSCDAIITQYDVPMLIHEVQLPVGLPVANMGAWNDDPIR